VRMWYRGVGAIFLGTAVFGVAGGVRMVTIRSIRLTSLGNKKKLYVRGKSMCVMIPVWRTLSGSCVWRWRSVK